MKTITDVAKIVGLSRRVIQEYEKAGVAIKPCQKNKYGYLIYDDTTIKRLWQIRFYRELGYDKNSIKTIFDDPYYDHAAALDAQIKLLEKKKHEIENLIGVANLMKKTGLTPKALYSHTGEMSDLTFNDTFGILSAITRHIPHGYNDVEELPLSDEEIERGILMFEYVLSMYKEGISYDDDSVQSAIQEFHKLATPWLTDTVFGLFMASYLIAPGSAGAAELEAEYELPGVAEYIQLAIHKYCNDNINKSVDKSLKDAIDELVSYGKKKYAPWSNEAQTVVSKIYEFYTMHFNTSLISPREMLEKSILMYSDSDYYMLFDKITRGRGAGKYVAATLKHFCKELDDLKQA